MPREGLFTKGGRPGPGRPKGQPNKVDFEAREYLRSIVDRADMRVLLAERLEHDLREGDCVFYVKMYAHAHGSPPQSISVEADGALRDTLAGVLTRGGRE